MTSSWFTMSMTRSPSIPVSLEYLISTSCSKLSQSVDIISHVKYLNSLKKIFPGLLKLKKCTFLYDMPHISCTYTRSSCPNKGTYWFHAKLPNIIQAVAHIWPHLRNEEYVGHRMVICNQLLHTFLTIWLVLCLFMKKNRSAPQKKQTNKQTKKTKQKKQQQTNKQTNRSAQSICVCHQYQFWLIMAYYWLIVGL